MAGQVVASSFEREYLQEMKEALPVVQIALLYSRPIADPCQEALREGWGALHSHLQLVDRRLIDAAHEQGILVRAWNPNDPEKMRELIALGVDGIGTDFPERLLQLAREHALVP